MKRILLSVFAAAITAAWAVPASATDFTFSGQYRLRGEYRNNSDFKKNVGDATDSWTSRLRLTTNAKVTDDTTVKITLQDTRMWGNSASTATSASGPTLTDAGGTNGNTVDIHESYVNINNLLGQPVAFKFGRQELVYGDERLVGNNVWNNNGRSFDAAKFVYGSDAVNVDLFLSKITENTATTTSYTSAKTDQNFYGIYGTVKTIPNNTLDIYVLLLDGDNTGLTKNGNLYTYGARLKGSAAGVDYTAEVPFQSGKYDTAGNSGKVSTLAYALQAGYTIPNTPKLRVGVEYDYASGDKDTTDNKTKTFQQLFPTNHNKYGYMDQVGWKNIKALNVNASVEPTDALKLTLSFWNFKLAEKADAWYTATGAVKIAANASNSSSSIGNEIDLVATYKLNSAVTAELGLARFMAGTYIKDSIGSANTKGDQDWAYLQITTNF